MSLTYGRDGTLLRSLLHYRRYLMEEKQQVKQKDQVFQDELISTLIAVSVVTKNLTKKVIAQSIKDEHTKGGENNG